eukprot:jgi/Antlo1/1740/1535
MNHRYFSKQLFMQALPSLLFSLLGLSLTGKWLDQSSSRRIFEKYPLLLISSCISSFKGNAELILAMHLSTMSHSTNMQHSQYNKYIFDNSCMVLSQSIVIGLSVGLLSAAKILINMRGRSHIYIIRIIASCLVSCFLSSLLIIFMMIVAIKVSLGLQINPDNVVLPAISSFGDFTSVGTCVFFIELYDKLYERECTISSLSVAFLFPVLIYISLTSKRRVPQQTVLALLTTYILSTTAGYMLDHYSRENSALAALSPVFCGLCGSTSYIFLNKKMTSLENMADMNIDRIFYTLLFLSTLVSVMYAALAYMLFLHLSLAFFFLFILFYFLNVCILLSGVDHVTRHYTNLNDGISTSALPLLTSFSDIIGMALLVGVVKVWSFFVSE